MARADANEVKVAAAAAVRQAPARDDPLFASLRRAEAGSPVLVHGPAGEPAYWLAPYVLRGRVCGLAEVDLAGQVVRAGILGGGPDDQAAWIDAAFFAAPPPAALSEIRLRYGPASAPAAQFSYDGSPARWAWRVEVGGPGPRKAVFITPNGWYERTAPPSEEWEG